MSVCIPLSFFLQECKSKAEKPKKTEACLSLLGPDVHVSFKAFNIVLVNTKAEDCFDSEYLGIQSAVAVALLVTNDGNRV